MAAEGDVITFIFTGEADEVIPHYATRFIAHESVTVIPRKLFYKHPKIIELICHSGVERIEISAFYYCRRLRRVIIPGVKVVERAAFASCTAVTYVECPMLERIGDNAFNDCKSLTGINLPSAKVVENCAFYDCRVMTDVKFSKQLESIGRWAFASSLCSSLERITIPLKDGLITDDNIFRWCGSLKHVDLVEGAVLRETVATLLWEEWRNDMNEEIESINQILPSAYAGDLDNVGGKAIAVREWITSVLHKTIRYKAQHQQLLNVAAKSLKLALPNDNVMNDVLPFLELPLHAFEGEDNEEDDYHGDSCTSSDGSDELYDTSDGDDDDDEDGDEDNNDNNNDYALHYASFGGGHHDEEGGDEVQVRKRRKTTNDDGIARRG